MPRFIIPFAVLAFFLCAMTACDNKDGADRQAPAWTNQDMAEAVNPMSKDLFDTLVDKLTRLTGEELPEGEEFKEVLPFFLREWIGGMAKFLAYAGDLTPEVSVNLTKELVLHLVDRVIVAIPKLEPDQDEFDPEVVEETRKELEAMTQALDEALEKAALDGEELNREADRVFDQTVKRYLDEFEAIAGEDLRKEMETPEMQEVLSAGRDWLRFTAKHVALASGLPAWKSAEVAMDLGGNLSSPSLMLGMSIPLFMGFAAYEQSTENIEVQPEAQELPPDLVLLIAESYCQESLAKARALGVEDLSSVCAEARDMLMKEPGVDIYDVVIEGNGTQCAITITGPEDNLSEVWTSQEQ